MTNDINVQVYGETQELVIREGEALKLQPPQKIKMVGDISTVNNFLAVRRTAGYGTQQIDISKAVITVNKDANYILLELDPENYYGALISGELQFSDELCKFYINQTKTFTREEIIKLFRFNKIHFADPVKHSELVDSYIRFVASAQTNMSQTSDTRGNKSNHLDKAVNSSVPTEFILNIPIFKGQPKERFRVEICLDVTDAGARFWFESVELAELTQLRKDEIFDREIAQCRDMVIVNM